jgi:TetR/AcrR family transcriptional regulator
MINSNRKQKEKLNRYNSILDTAEIIIKANGLYSLNMDMIARESQLAKGTLYLYFKSKEEILAALSIKARMLLLTHFERAAQRFQKAVEKLKAIAMATFGFYKKYPFYFDLIAIYEVNNKLEETQAIQDSINKLINFVAGITGKAKTEGAFGDETDPMQFTFCLWGMLIGMTQLIKVRVDIVSDYNHFTEKDIIATFIRQLTKGMKG